MELIRTGSPLLEDDSMDAERMDMHEYVVCFEVLTDARLMCDRHNHERTLTTARRDL